MKENKFPGEVITCTTRGISNEEVPRIVRYGQILEILKDSKEPMTAKQIAVVMCNKNYIPTSERNFTSPRLTELQNKNIVEAVDKVKCEYTGKMVSRFKLRKMSET